MKSLNIKEKKEVQEVLQKEGFYEKTYELYRKYNKDITLQIVKDRIDKTIDKTDKDRMNLKDSKRSVVWQSLYRVKYIMQMHLMLAKNFQDRKKKIHFKKIREIKPISIDLPVSLGILRKLKELEKSKKELEAKVGSEINSIVEKLKGFEIRFDFRTEGDSNGKIYTKELLIYSFNEIETDDDIYEISDYFFRDKYDPEIFTLKVNKSKNNKAALAWINFVIEEETPEDSQIILSNLRSVIEFVRILPIDLIFKIVEKNKSLRGKDYANNSFHSFID